MHEAQKTKKVDAFLSTDSSKKREESAIVGLDRGMIMGI
jgi:hypothetical protein